MKPASWKAFSLMIALCLAMLLLAATPPSQHMHVQVGATTDAQIGAASVIKTNVTASVNVKASFGNLYGLYVLNGAASTCYVQVINSASAGTIGTNVVAAFPLPASTTTPVYLPFEPPVGGFTNGIAVGIATTANGSTPCGTGGNVTVLYQ